MIICCNTRWSFLLHINVIKSFNVDLALQHCTIICRDCISLEWLYCKYNYKCVPSFKSVVLWNYNIANDSMYGIRPVSKHLVLYSFSKEWLRYLYIGSHVYNMFVSCYKNICYLCLFLKIEQIGKYFIVHSFKTQCIIYLVPEPYQLRCQVPSVI